MRGSKAVSSASLMMELKRAPRDQIGSLRDYFWKSVSLYIVLDESLKCIEIFGHCCDFAVYIYLHWILDTHRIGLYNNIGHWDTHRIGLCNNIEHWSDYHAKYLLLDCMNLHWQTNLLRKDLKRKHMSLYIVLDEFVKCIKTFGAFYDFAINFFYIGHWIHRPIGHYASDWIVQKTLDIGYGSDWIVQ
ncbi:hypothetical protein CEXT_331821 [Caerostris extrusa]|uniref:Maturase K n=1 Tax=Caerostris extrusa TaxID=172846 RepID=A0AAV4TAU2_CAEEX|nr:hypothetical protein CEXT_331821 [Caerostris extrusa]